MLILVIGLIVAGFCLYLGIYRNNQVYKHTGRILDQVSKSALEDVGKGRAWEWRYKEYSTVSYYSMVLKFWIPISRFYRDLDCWKSKEVEW